MHEIFEAEKIIDLMLSFERLEERAYQLRISNHRLEAQIEYTRARLTYVEVRLIQLEMRLRVLQHRIDKLK